MTATPRLDRLDGPPVPGRFYLVPTIRYAYYGIEDDWPVIGPKHTDPEFFNFHDEHYHIDARFLNRRQRHRLDATQDGRTWGLGWDGVVQSAPLACRTLHHDRIDPHPEPVWRRRRCQMARVPYLYGHMESVRALRAAFAGDRLRRDADGGLICPHRGADLTCIPADEHGVVTCPLHGLRFHAETGLAVAEGEARR